MLRKKVYAKQTNIISWTPESAAVESARFSPPLPAKEFIPDWYKAMPKYAHNENKIDTQMAEPNFTAKACVPLIDGFTTGFIQATPCDLYFDRNAQDDLSIVWPRQFEWEPVRRPRDFSAMVGFRHPDGYDPNPFLWIQPSEFGVPDGWSVLITHPLNRMDLPFRTMSAVVDSDVFRLRSEITFYVKTGFTGLMPKGTPMFQIIPFQRVDWESSLQKFDPVKRDWWNFAVRDTYGNAYREKFWQKKSYAEQSEKCPYQHEKAESK